LITLGKQPIKFQLKKEFKDDLLKREINWGYGGLSAFTYYRTYARKKANGKLETWQDCIIRVIEGMFSLLKTHSLTSGQSWDEKKGHKLAEEAAERLFEFKWTPPGRGLWMMGTPFVAEKGGAALNNCGFVSTENIDAEMSKPFAFLMDMSMVGVGVGFDTKGAGKIAVTEPQGEPELVIVEDSREGWVELIACLIDSFFEEGSTPILTDTSLVREYGAPIVGFGGVASGPEPLLQGFYAIRDILTRRAQSDNPLITVVDIVDIMNIIGKIVVAGNVRRTAEIAFGEPDDEEFANMKNWQEFGVETGSIGPEELKEIDLADYTEYNTNYDSRARIAKKYADHIWSYKFGGWRWASNNSIFAKLGMDYTKVGAQVANSGEPGFAWLENMQAYGRMKDPADHKDYRVRGGNPCLEQSLEPYELCCLVETYPAKHEDYWDFQRTLKFAYLYAKAVTLVPTHWRETNDVIKRNRRIGTSQSGIQEAILKFGRKKYLDDFCDSAYNYINYLDKKYSEWLGVPLSIKKTSVKPSGTVSLVVGALPGIHYAEAESYYRLIRVSNTSHLLPILQDAGYRIEPASSDPLRTSVVYFPVTHMKGTVSKKDVSIWEQFTNAVDMQHYWADNQVSITITYCLLGEWKSYGEISGMGTKTF